MDYRRKCGRVGLTVTNNGMRMQDYGHGAHIECPDGWNDSCPIVRITLSVEELRDLQHMIGRALSLAEQHP